MTEVGSSDGDFSGDGERVGDLDAAVSSPSPGPSYTTGTRKVAQSIAVLQYLVEGMYEFAMSDPDETLVRVGWPTRLRTSPAAHGGGQS